MVTGPLEENCYILKEGEEGVLIDPGYDPEKIETALKEVGCKLKYIICTHGHVDHVGAVGRLQEKYNIPCYLNDLDVFLTKDLLIHGMLFGMPDVTLLKETTHYDESTELKLGNNLVI